MISTFRQRSAKLPATGMSFFAEGGFVRAVDQIQVVLHAVLTDHTAFAQRLKRKRGGEICDADQLHVFLQRNAIGQALTTMP